MVFIYDLLLSEFHPLLKRLPMKFHCLSVSAFEHLAGMSFQLCCL